MKSIAERPIQRRQKAGGKNLPWVRLTGGWIALDASTSVRADLEIVNGRVSRLIGQNTNGSRRKSDQPAGPGAEIPVEGCLVLPGLINSHDHLEFNLFPRLGHGPYRNFAEWAFDIFHPDKSPIREQLGIPKPIRLWWGGLKNLLSGVTTVCHHNKYEEDVFGPEFPVHVVRQYGWTHSLRLGKDVTEAFLSTPPGVPFIIHLAEGSDRGSGNEIFDLDRKGALDSRTVIVHGVGLTRHGHELLRRRGAALVWCPTSNRFTLGTTLNPSSLEGQHRVSLGSDSALTARGDLLDEIRAAGSEGMGGKRIYSMVTEAAADVLKLRNGEGTLRPGAKADLVVVKREDIPPAETVMRTHLETIEMVMVSGEPRLLSARMARGCPLGLLDGFEELEIEGIRCSVRVPVQQLLKETQLFLGSGVRLAGKRVTA